MYIKLLRYTLLIPFVSLMIGCTSLPEGIQPVQNFDLERYLGKWYEVARLDHSFERGLNQVSAEYSMREDGGVEVINRGWDTQKNKWKEAVGKAYFVDSTDTGHLKVSFFGPFYGAYVIFSLDPDYQYSFVSGPDRDYLWLLARTPTVPTPVMQRFKQQAMQLGFDMSKLIIVNP
jgi:apolipoprotein D and lipocalin family protein